MAPAASDLFRTKPRRVREAAGIPMLKPRKHLDSNHTDKSAILVSFPNDGQTGSYVFTFSSRTPTTCPEVGLEEFGACRELDRGQESPNIGSYSPFDEHILQRLVFALDCALGTQSRVNLFGRLRGVVLTTFSHTIRQSFASRSFAKPHCLACRMGSRQSPENSRTG